jgi:hypothetical protein
MIVKTNGTKFEDYRLYETQLNRPYDYAHDGLLKNLMSRRIIKSKNTFLQYMLQVVEQSLIFQLKYVDKLQNVFNYNLSNR